jgi:hypothetical protein
MGNISVDIMPPSYWQDFERLTLDWAKRAWNDQYAERNGRQGQAQAGVDVSGFNYGQREHTGVQCKKRIWLTKPGSDAPSNTLTPAEIDAEVKAARAFVPARDRFIIATTGPRDADLQEHVRKLNSGNTKPAVSLMFWDDFVDFLNDHPDLMYRYYEGVLKYRNTYSPNEHYYRLLYMAYDRPAIRTPLTSENRATDLITALSQTQEAISTGVLKDRDNRVIDQARVPHPCPKELKLAAKKLQKARDLATEGLYDARIVEHSGCIEIKDPVLVGQINTLRRESADLLNQVLQANQLQILPPAG